MKKMLRAASAQITGHLKDMNANVEDACRLSTEAAEQGARLIQFPEGCLTGNALTDPSHQPTLNLDERERPFVRLKEVAARHGIAICAGFTTRWGRKFNVVHAVIQPKGPVLFQRKAARASTEPVFLAPWPDLTRHFFEVDGVRCVNVICSEMGHAGVVDAVIIGRPQLILHCSAGCLPASQVLQRAPTPEEEAAMDKEMHGVVEGAAKATAKSGIPRLTANPVGFDGETYWPGNSYVVDGSGKVLLWIKGTKVLERMQPSMSVTDIPV
ncbi:MAG: carbon-nitrogen hydrolase family protein [Lentisphaerae bacterium]|nr:carbon-nitrogen hydrolase family protein [Lentisphaerota bacterium]